MTGTITKSAGGTVFAGQEAVGVGRAIILKSALGLLKKGMKPSRQWTGPRVLAAVSNLTGKNYKRGAYAQAEDDIKAWLEAARQSPTLKIGAEGERAEQLGNMIATEGDAFAGPQTINVPLKAEIKQAAADDDSTD